MVGPPADERFRSNILIYSHSLNITKAPDLYEGGGPKRLLFVPYVSRSGSQFFLIFFFVVVVIIYIAHTHSHAHNWLGTFVFMFYQFTFDIFIL